MYELTLLRLDYSIIIKMTNKEVILNKNICRNCYVKIRRYKFQINLNLNLIGRLLCDIRKILVK